MYTSFMMRWNWKRKLVSSKIIHTIKMTVIDEKWTEPRQCHIMINKRQRCALFLLVGWGWIWSSSVKNDIFCSVVLLERCKTWIHIRVKFWCVAIGGANKRIIIPAEYRIRAGENNDTVVS